MAAPARAGANSTDKATQWLNQNSAGAGAFTLVGWTRNAQILLTRNPHYWRGPAHFEHVVIRHMGDSATQLLAVKRGDIDAAFNLIPEQIATLKGDQGRARGRAGEPGFRVHGADLRAGVQQGAGGEGGTPGDLERDRL